MEKVKIAVIDGPEEILGYFGDNIQKTDNLYEAHLIIMAGSTEISPEYYNQTAKDESLHDPAKDYKLYNLLQDIHRHNPRAIIVGLRHSANFVDVFCGGSIKQEYKIKEKEITVGIAYGHSGDVISPDTRMILPYFKHYCSVPGSSVYNYMSTKISNNEHMIVSRYSNTSLRNYMFSIHVDPFMLDPESIEWLTIRAILFQSVYPQRTPEDLVMRLFSDTSIWASRSNEYSDMNWSLNSHACFGSMVKGALASHAKGNNKAHVNWIIRVMKPAGWTPSNGRCLTFFKAEEYDEYYKRLQQIYPFEYTVDDSKDEYVTIKLDINAPCMWHKMILTQIRFIYQYPMHFILKDALELKKMDDYKDMDIIDLLNIVAKSLATQAYESGEYMILPYYKNSGENIIMNPFNDEEFRKIAEKEGASSDYPSINEIGRSYTTKCPEGFKYIEGIVPVCVSWNVFTRSFDLRLPFYSNNIKVFKKLLK